VGIELIEAIEDENYDEVIEEVYLVTTNAFDEPKVFRYRVDALHYGFDFVAACGSPPALELVAYNKVLKGTGKVIIRSADIHCGVATTVRKERIRRKACLPKVREL